jgi:putative transposase
MPSMIELDNAEWALVGDLFDPPAREGRPARYQRRQVVEAILFLARTGCQWRYLPACYPPWEAVWQQWRRWRASGVWARAMARIAALIRVKHGRSATPSMVMIDGQTVRGGRGGPTFHDKGGRGGRTNGAKRSIVIEILGLPLAVSVESARPHDVSAGRRLLGSTQPALGTVKAIVADRGYKGLGKMASKAQVKLEIKVPPKGGGFTPIRPLYKVEHAFARLGRWRRLSRCYEGTPESARAWLEVAALGYLFARLRAEPA